MYVNIFSNMTFCIPIQVYSALRIGRVTSLPKKKAPPLEGPTLKIDTVYQLHNPIRFR